MAYEVRIGARAASDVDEVMNWLSRRGARIALRWHANFLKAVSKLEFMPERYGLAREATSLGIDLREMLLGKRGNVFRILFIIDGDTVHVLHIRRGARNWLKPDEL